MTAIPKMERELMSMFLAKLTEHFLGLILASWLQSLFYEDFSIQSRWVRAPNRNSQIVKYRFLLKI